MAKTDWKMKLRILRKAMRGGTAIEYAVVASFISVAAIGAMAALGQQAKTNLDDVHNKTEAALAGRAGAAGQ